MVYGILERLFREGCPACGLGSDGGFCGVCAAGLPRIARACRRCGLAEPVAHCPRKEQAWDVDAVIAPFSYRPPLDHYLQAMKYRGARALGRAFALLLIPSLAQLEGVDALAAVPLHGSRLRERVKNIQRSHSSRVIAR